MDLKFDPENPKYEYVTDDARAIEVLEHMSHEKMLALDVEANSLDPYTGTLLMVQLGPEDISYLFDVRTVHLDKIPLFKQILEDNKIVKLLQNGKFDYKYIKVKYGIEVKNIYDTMLAESVLKAGMGAAVGLKAISDRYVKPGVLDKALQKSFADMTQHQQFTDEQLRYAAADTLILFPIFQKQFEQLRKHDVLKIAKLEFAVTTVVGDMELKGIYINKEKWLGIIRNLEEQRDAIAKEFQLAIRPYYKVSQNDLFGGVADSININSQQQLMDLFNNKLGLDMPSTGSAILNNVSHPIVDLLSKYRKHEKLISAFGYELIEKINPITHRMHPDFAQMRTATGRFACNNPNIQQIPRNTKEAPFRECFNPEPGYKLVVSDYSGFEMRILADLSGDEKMIHALSDSSMDIHGYTAALMFGKEYTPDFKKLYPDLRQMAKPIGFGLMYGMGAMGLIGRIKQETGKEITPEESQDLIDKYFKAYPSVKTFLDTLAKNAVRNGFSATPAGRKRWYKLPEKNDPDYRKKISKIERESKNHPIQGTNADVIKYALVYVSEYMKDNNIDGSIVLTVHDEIACEVREDQAEEFAKVLQSEMIRAGKLYIKKVPVKSDPFVGDVWEH